MQQAARELDTLIYAEIAERRASGRARRGHPQPAARRLTTRTATSSATLQIRDEVMTLLFAGHDTTTSTVSFMFYELARHPHIAERLLAEQDALLDATARAPSAAQLTSGELTELEMVLDETLRKYPPAWVGPRRAVESFEFDGHTIPARAFVNYSSWASHHLPDVFDRPEEFRPERFTPEARAALPKGAYVPFGGGSRTCIGMRFGQLEVRTIATLLLSRFTLLAARRLRAEDPPDADDQPRRTACRCASTRVRAPRPQPSLLPPERCAAGPASSPTTASAEPAAQRRLAAMPR